MPATGCFSADVPISASPARTRRSGSPSPGGRGVLGDAADHCAAADRDGTAAHRSSRSARGGPASRLCHAVVPPDGCAPPPGDGADHVGTAADRARRPQLVPVDRGRADPPRLRVAPASVRARVPSEDAQEGPRALRKAAARAGALKRAPPWLCAAHGPAPYGAPPAIRPPDLVISTQGYSSARPQPSGVGAE